MGDGATDDSDVLLAKAEVRGRRKQVERAIDQLEQQYRRGIDRLVREAKQQK